MWRFLFRLCVLVVLFLAIRSCWSVPPLRFPPGIVVPAEPLQLPCDARVIEQRGEFKITTVASYAFRGRVLSTHRYWAGDASSLVPYDVAAGWGPMSNQAVLDELKISQSNRFFFYEWKNEPPIPPDEIRNHAANIHVISADAEVAKTIRRLRVGQILIMSGFLVNVDGPNGFQWKSSLSRTDSGNGACEIFYVQFAVTSDAP